MNAHQDPLLPWGCTDQQIDEAALGDEYESRRDRRERIKEEQADQEED